MSENCEKYGSLFPRANVSALKCLLLSWQTAYNSIYCHGGWKKQENIHIWVNGIGQFGNVFLKKWMN